MSHPSHKTRLSDSSLYDEVCKLCGANDGRHGSAALDRVCPENPRRFEHGTVLIPGPCDSFLLLDHIKAKQYRFPGGALEWFEQPIAAAARELYEELGIVAHDLRRIAMKKHFVSGNDWVGHYYLCSQYEGVPRIMEERKHRAIKYLTLEMMQGMLSTNLVHPSDYEIAKQYVHRQR